MAQLASTPSFTCCCRRVVKFPWPQQLQRRSMASLHIGPVQKLELPPDLPEQYWPQLPKRLRPDHGKRKIKIHGGPQSEKLRCKDPIKFIDDQQKSTLDPTGARTRLFDPKNPDGAKAGDILTATFATGEPFSGVALSIKSRGPHTSVLLRNQLTRVGTEMLVKVFSPLVQSMEIVQKATKRPRRARLYYMRKPEHDIGSVQKTVDVYMRQRAMLSGGKPQGGVKRQGGPRGSHRR